MIDLNQVIAELHEQKRKLDMMIDYFEDLQGFPVEYRTITIRSKPGRKPMSMTPAERREVSARMHRYWDRKRKAHQVAAAAS